MLVTRAEAVSLLPSTYVTSYLLLILSFPPINYWPKYVVVLLLREEVAKYLLTLHKAFLERHILCKKKKKKTHTFFCHNL